MNLRRSIIIAELWRPEVARRWKKIIFCVFFWKNDLLRQKFFKILFRKYSSPHRSTCSIQISWNLADGKSVKSCVMYLTKKTKFRVALQLSLLYKSQSKSARASPRQCNQSAPDFIQIGSLSAELYPNAWRPFECTRKWIQYSAEA